MKRKRHSPEQIVQKINIISEKFRRRKDSLKYATILKWAGSLVIGRKRNTRIKGDAL